MTLPIENAPILAVLGRPNHASLLSPDEVSLLTAWVVAGTPSIDRGVHPAEFADPRSPGGHATFLRLRRYRPMIDADDGEACGRCHEGGGPRPEKVTLAAPGATACASCHVEEGGAFACSTCHGSPGKAYPPRDRCFFPDAPADSAHAAHAAPSAARQVGLACGACHPQPALGTFDALHANGWVEVWFDYAVAGRLAQFDVSSKRCTGTCHARGGARPTPAWTEGSVGCGDCHGSPPRNHYAGACSSCHREADAKGTALAATKLHMNGKVDLGDGSGKCGACHGEGDSPWPTTGAHQAHRAPTGAAAVSCDTCHELPRPGAVHPIGKGAATVRLGGLATKNGNRASYDPATKTCSATYCHRGRGGALTAPAWTDGANARACGACHSSPPPAPHANVSGCGTVFCHTGIVDADGVTITAAGSQVHVNGVVDRKAQ